MKTELLEQIEQRELEYLNSLSDKALAEYIDDWFLEAEIPKDYDFVRNVWVNDYMENFMRWQNDKGVEELEETLGYQLTN